MGTDQHVSNGILCKAADPNQDPVLEMGFCSDSKFSNVDVLNLGNCIFLN